MLLVIDLTVLNVISSSSAFEERPEMILSCIGAWDVRSGHFLSVKSACL